MNDEVKPQTQPDGAAPADTAPVATNNGADDQSTAASNAVPEGTTTAQPESAGVDAAQPDASQETPVSTEEQTAAAAALQAQAPVEELAQTPAAPSAAPVVVSTPPPPAPTPKPAPVAPVANVAPVVQESANAGVAGLTKWDNVNALIKDVPAGKLGIIHFLSEYVRDMAPRRPIPEKEGATYQVNLYRQLHTLINREDKYFRPLFTAVLRIIENEGAGCFRSSHAFRFMETAPFNKNERISFQALLDMMRLLGPVKGRKDVAKQVSLDKVLAKNMTDTGRSRVLSYFGDSI